MLKEYALESFAESVARIYCARFNDWNLYDDAKQEASVWLLKNRRLWTKPKKELTWRTFLAVCRWYQDQHGTRRKHKLKLVYQDDVEVMTETNVEERIDAKELFEQVVEQALILSKTQDDEELIRRHLSGETIQEAANRLGVGRYNIKRRIAPFKTAYNQIVDEIRWQLSQKPDETSN